MRVRALDINGDWLFGKGQNDYKVNRDALAQNLQTRINSFLHDCFFADSAGIDWFNLLGSKNILGLQLSVTSTILNTAYVTSIASFSMSLVHRNISLDYTVNTAFGQITFSNFIGIPTQYILTEGGSILTTESGNQLVT